MAVGGAYSTATADPSMLTWTPNAVPAEPVLAQVRDPVDLLLYVVRRSYTVIEDPLAGKGGGGGVEASYLQKEPSGSSGML